VGWPKWQVTEVMSRRPQVRVNQLGYLPGRPKQATLISDAQDPVPFAIRDRDGVVVYTGFSRPWSVRPETTSGRNVHVLDFTGLTMQGAGFQIESADQSGHPFEVTNSVYNRLRADALGFFYVMRSGTPILDSVAPGYGRPAGHAGQPPNRGDSAVPAWTGVEARRLYPGWRCKGTFDVSGGWYDAGDYGKYVTSGGIAVWQLLSTLDLLRRSDSSLPIREFADLIRRECRWQLDWLMRMQVPPGDPLSGVGFPPCARHAVVADAGLGPRGPADPAYMRKLLQTARTAYQAARRHPHLIAPDDHARFGGGPYADDELRDDFYWASVELWLTTDEEFYRQEVLSSAVHVADAFDPAGFDVDRVAAVGQLDLALAGRHLVDYDRVVETLQLGADRLLELQRHQPWGQPYAPTPGVALGVQRQDPQQPRGAGSGTPGFRCFPPCRCRRDRDGLPAWAECSRSELHHRVRHRLPLPPADPPVWP
jgi:endoglucanase